MIRITANVVLWKKSELQRPENLRILALVMATLVLAFIVSPILGAIIAVLMVWQNSRGSLAIDAAKRAAEMNLQIGSSVAENPN